MSLAYGFSVMRNGIENISYAPPVKPLHEKNCLIFIFASFELEDTFYLCKTGSYPNNHKIKPSILIFDKFYVSL